MIYSVFIRWKGNSGFLADYSLLGVTLRKKICW